MSRSSIHPWDVLPLGVLGLRARPVRSALSALGIALAVGALVSVLGIAASAKADLLAELGAEGNLLTVAAGQTFSGNPTPLPATAERMIRAVPPVRDVTGVGNIDSATVRRSSAVPVVQTSGITMLAAEPSLLDTLGATMLDGHFLDPVAARYPEVVLGFNAAQNLGIPELTATTQVYVADQYLTVIGILDPVATAPEMDNAALVSFPAAVARLRYDAGITRIYLRVDPDQVAAVAAVLPFTASPAAPEAVEVRRPSDILRARVAAKTAFVGVFLALGTVALTIGGVGIANTMVIAVLERRGEIGLRRALGARRSHIAVQFLIEASILAVIGGILGLALGCLGTVLGAYATNSPVVIPASAPALGLGAALVVGVLAGVYPAGRAARTEPASALRTT